MAGVVSSPAHGSLRRDDAAHEVLHEIRTISRHLAEHSARLARDTGVTVPQLMCLKAIGELGADHATVATVSARIELSPATVSRIVDRLCRGQLVNRVRHPEDRRKVGLVLTADGRAQFTELPPPFHERFMDRFIALEVDDRKEIVDSLRRLSALMEG
jgi:DNA-binding MarR family transcriptional regulator